MRDNGQDSVMKRKRRTLKDRLLEVSSILSPEKEVLFAAVSKRRKKGFVKTVANKPVSLKPIVRAMPKRAENSVIGAMSIHVAPVVGRLWQEQRHGPVVIRVGNHQPSPHLVDLQKLFQPLARRQPKKSLLSSSAVDLSKNRQLSSPVKIEQPLWRKLTIVRLVECIAVGLERTMDWFHRDQLFKGFSFSNWHGWLRSLSVRHQFKPVPLIALTSRQVFKPVAVFLAIALLVAVPLSVAVTGSEMGGKLRSVRQAAASALSDWSLAKQYLTAGEWEQAAGAFNSAASQWQDSFQILHGLVEQSAVIKNLVAINPTVGQLANGQLLNAAERLSRLGAALTEAGQTLESGVAGQRLTLLGNGKLDTESPTAVAFDFSVLSQLADNLDNLSSVLGDLDGQSPIWKLGGETLASLGAQLPLLREQVNHWRMVAGATSKFVNGHPAERFSRYLILLQNNRELRPTGGFMGGIAEATFENGKLSKLLVPPGGPYDFQGQQRSKIVAPEGLRLLKEKLELQDANWWLDYPTSAKAVIDLYQSAGGPTVDGVIAITADWLPLLLDIIGPVTVAVGEQTVAVNSQNVLDVLERSEAYGTKEQPKSLFQQFIPALLNQTIKVLQDDWQSKSGLVLDVLSQAARQKSLLAYSIDQELELDWQALGVSGNIELSSRDYLAIASANVGGGKTDQQIQQRVEHTAVIDNDGQVNVTLMITRGYEGAGQRNVSYLRTYLPDNVSVLSVTGEIRPAEPFFKSAAAADDPDMRLGKTVVGAWSVLDPGQEQTITIRYVLGKKIIRPDYYGLLLQAQPGFGYEFRHLVIAPDSWTSVWAGASVGEASITSWDVPTVRYDGLYAVYYR
ncbi:MAG: DUF4012 domain-containing protein [bacterium]